MIDDLFETPQPTQEYKRKLNELIRSTIQDIGLLENKQKGDKDPNPQQGGSVVENLIKSWEL